jgi:hypothetical protein
MTDPKNYDANKAEQRALEQILGRSFGSDHSNVVPKLKAPDAADHAAVERSIREKETLFQRLYSERDPARIQDLWAKMNEKPEWSRPDADKKSMVTREQYDQAKAVLDALPPGFYFKCADCGGWYSGSKNAVIYDDSKGPVCHNGCD